MPDQDMAELGRRGGNARWSKLSKRERRDEMRRIAEKGLKRLRAEDRARKSVGERTSK